MPTELFAAYSVTFASLAALALFLVVQVVVATAAAQNEGHAPGAVIPSGSFAFRAQRAHQNSLENAVPFVLALASAIAIGVSSALVDAAAVGFVASRGIHAVSYYADVRPARTAAFAAGLIAVLTMSLGALATVAAAPSTPSVSACSR